jgi:hypothetical protein
MACFTEGLYASRYDEAAMVGYVQSHSLAHWKSKLKNAISGKAVELNLKSSQCDVKVIDAFPLECLVSMIEKGV